MFLFTYFVPLATTNDVVLDKWDDEHDDLPEIVLHVPEIIVSEQSLEIIINQPEITNEIEIIVNQPEITNEIEIDTNQSEIQESLPIFYSTCTYPSRSQDFFEKSCEWILGEVAFLQLLYFHS